MYQPHVVRVAALSCRKQPWPACLPCKIVVQHSPLQRCLAPVLQLKGILMAIYFGADHIVWASQAGLYTDKQGTER